MAQLATGSKHFHPWYIYKSVKVDWDILSKFPTYRSYSTAHTINFCPTIIAIATICFLLWSLLCIINPIITSSSEKYRHRALQNQHFPRKSLMIMERPWRVMSFGICCSVVWWSSAHVSEEHTRLHFHSWRIIKQANSAYKSTLQPWRQRQYIPLNCS